MANSPDLSHLSDDQLQAIASGRSSSSDFAKPTGLDHLSDDQLAQIAGGKASSKDFAPPIKSQPSTGKEAFAAGLGNGVTLGYAPQIGAGVVAPIVDAGIKYGSKVGAAFGIGRELHPPEDTYTQRRDENIKNQNALAESNPVAYGLGDVAGSIATTAVPGTLASKLGLLTKGANAEKALVTAEKAKQLGLAEKLIGAGSRTLQQGATGAGLGLVANPGDTEGQVNPVQFDKRVENAKSGGEMGLISGVGTEALSGVANAAGKGLKSLAETKAFKASGAMLKDFRNAYGKGKVNEIGRTLLDEKVVTPFATPKTIVARLEGKIDDATAAINGAIEKIQAGTAEAHKLKPEQAAQLEASFFRPRDVAANLKQQIKDEFKHVPQEKLDPAYKEIDIWFKGKPDIMSIKEVHEFKKELGSFLKKSDFHKPSGEIPFTKQGTLAVRRGLKEGVEKQADAVSTMLGGAGGEIKGANRNLGNLIEAHDIASDRISRDAAKDAFGLGDKILAAGGMGLGGGVAGGVVGGLKDGNIEGVAGGVATGAALGLAGKLGRTYGNSVMATSANQAAKQLLKIPQMAELLQKNPTAFQTVLNKLVIGQKNESAPQIVPEENAMQRRMKSK